MSGRLSLFERYDKVKSIISQPEEINKKLFFLSKLQFVDRNGLMLIFVER